MLTYATFSTIDSNLIRAVDIEKSIGVKPSRFIVEAAATGNISPAPGTLTFYVDTNKAEELQDVAVVDAWLLNDKRSIYRLVLEDRRRKLSRHRISGVYNKRQANGELLSTGAKTARELVDLLLTTAGESADLSDIPTFVYPYVNWDNVRVSDALESLLDSLSCSLCVDTTRIRGVWLGYGSSVSSTATTNDTRIFTPQSFPESVRVIGGATKYQSKWILEAVGKDTDGTIKPIDLLSYKPASWSESWVNSFSDVSATSRHLAFETVFRWYRIKEQVTGGLSIPGSLVVPLSIRDIVLTDKLAQYSIDVNGNVSTLDAYVQGTFWLRGDTGVNSPVFSYHGGHFTVDADNYLIRFDDPVYKMGSCGPEKPDLYLTTSYYVKKSTGALNGYSKSQSVGGDDGFDDVILPELFNSHIVNYTDDKGAVSTIADRTAILDAEANNYLLLRANKYTNRDKYHIKSAYPEPHDNTGIANTVTSRFFSGEPAVGEVSINTRAFI